MPSAPTAFDYEALLDMAGFFGAQTGALATQLTVTSADHLNDIQEKDLILIGTPDAQPLFSEWASTMPLGFSGPDIRVNQAAPSTLLLHPEWPFRIYDSGRLSRLISANNNTELFVQSFVSPLRSDRVVVAIVPGGTNATNAMRALFTPSEREGPVYGGVAIHQEGRFESFLVGTQAFHSGKLDRYQYTAVLLIENYRLIPLLVVVFAVLIVAWVRSSTERVAAQRLATES
jgi:hypothetical protein